MRLALVSNQSVSRVGSGAEQRGLVVVVIVVVVVGGQTWP